MQVPENAVDDATDPHPLVGRDQFFAIFFTLFIYFLLEITSHYYCRNLTTFFCVDGAPKICTKSWAFIKPGWCFDV